MENLENMKLDNGKPIHKDFYRVASHFLVSGSQEPIVLEGPKDSNIESIVESLSELMGQNPKEFDYGHMRIDDVFYGLGMNRMLERSVAKGEFVIIKGLSQNMYDEIELTAFVDKYYCLRKKDRHPEFRMLILKEDTEEKLYSPLYTRCATIKISKDYLLEESIKSKGEPIKVKDAK